MVGLSGALVVVLAAYGAHGLQGLDDSLLITFQKGVAYQQMHTLAMFGVATLLFHLPRSYWLKMAGWGFIIGIILFSGSLYVMVFTGVRSLGLVTPLGGLAFIFGWFSLAWAAYREIPLLSR
ncbi:MAG: DUF423 domain-containing protein [Candidatus Polarisedimenticolaceae bacterium]|nr:DUF423 domain-containing protein [Candidatus Polarisedimenticolaceae bacterium]